MRDMAQKPQNLCYNLRLYLDFNSAYFGLIFC